MPRTTDRKTPTRIVARSLVVALAAGGLVILPPTAWSAPEPEPISPEVESIPVDGVDQEAANVAPEPEAPGSAPLEPSVVTEPIKTEVEFGLVGVTFDESPPDESTVQVRVREDDGWTDWQQLPIDAGHGPDPGDPDYEDVRPSTEPLLTDHGDKVQLRLDTPNGKEVAGTEIKVVESTESPFDEAAITGQGSIASASAATPRPTIISRAAWGADESLGSTCPGLTDAHRVAFVHHTASTSEYDRFGAPSQLRNILAWTTSNGYCDMPYNFLVDRYGKIYEGRHGGVSLPVKSGATASFNNGSMSVSALGTFAQSPSNGFTAMSTSIAKLIGWKLGLTNRAADWYESLTATGYSGGAAAGTIKSFNRVSGHRDAFSTSCPGYGLYSKLRSIRTIAAANQDVDRNKPPTAQVPSPDPAPAPNIRTTSTITQWSSTKRTKKRGSYYRSAFRVTPGDSRTVKIKRKRPGRSWKTWAKVQTDPGGYARFRLKFYKGTSVYRLVAPRTATAKRTQNGRLFLYGTNR
jgi:hypothetical protein